MIYLAVCNTPVLHSAPSPLEFKGRVGRRNRKGKLGRQDGEKRSQLPGEAAELSDSGWSLRRARIFSPKIYARVKRRQP